MASLSSGYPVNRRFAIALAFPAVSMVMPLRIPTEPTIEINENTIAIR
jgi:hypothetical protein